jgi:AraC-like DNA-binding protein
VEHAFSLTTSDAEEFQQRIAPLAGACRVRPASGTRFDIAVRAVKAGGLGMFVVKAPSISVFTPPPHGCFGVNIPLGKPFTTSESSRRHRFSNDFHLLHSDRPLNLKAAAECRALAVKLSREQVLDYAAKLSGARRPFEPASSNRLACSTTLYRALIHSIAGLWSDLQRVDRSPVSPIEIAEKADAVFTHFVLASEGATKLHGRYAYQADRAAVERAVEYLRARLTQPVSRAELAAVTGVSIRTLSRGFSERWGMGPMAFLRTQRLEAAYRELLGAAPCQASVTEVAFRYGFTHLGEFAGRYKRAFHESPSETLRH